MIKKGKGKGLSRHPYKMETDGKYGNLQIGVPQLVESKRLIVRGGGSIMMEENVDSDLIDLLTKRMETKRIYSNLCQDIFRQINQSLWLTIKKKKQKV